MMIKKENGFTLIEMIFCISVILVILLLVIPEVTSKNRIVKEKSCDAQIEVVNSQIVLYEIEIVQQFFKTLEITSFSTFFYSFFASITHILRSFISKCGIKNIFFYFLTITMKELIDDTIEDINRFIIHFRSECYISI